MDISSLPLFLSGAATLGAAFVLLKASWRIASPDEAIIISGIQQKDDLGFKIVTGAGAFVLPAFQTARYLDLAAKRTDLVTTCVTQQGIPVNVSGVVVYKVGDSKAEIAAAARRFLNTKDEEIASNIQDLLDGHLRAIIGGLTIEELIRSRDRLINETLSTAGADMEKLGLVIQSLQIKEIKDPSGYIQSLAAPHVAEVQKAARIAQAQADQEATQQEQAALATKAEATKKSAVLRAQYEAEQNAAKAEAEQAGPLAQAKAKQAVVIAETETAKLEAAQIEQQLQVEVRKPADAEAYAARVRAEGARDAAIAKATAEAETVRLRGLADAEIIRIKGASEGEAITFKLRAEADGLKLRAEALATNQEAVIGQILAEKMPEIVRESAGAYKNVREMIVLDGSTGISRGLSQIVGMGAAVLPVVRQLLDGSKKPAPPLDPAPPMVL